MKKPISFKNKYNLTLRGFVSKPKKYDVAIIILHGFPSRCSGFTCSRIFEELGKKQLVMTFNFSGTDTSDGKFEDKLISKEVQDIKYAIDFLQSKYDYKQLILVGHSTGAINSALYANKDKRIDKIVLIAGTSDLSYGVKYEFTPSQVKDMWTKGFFRYNMPEKWYHKKKLKRAYYVEFFRLDVLKQLHKFKKPVLIVHGEKDEYLPVNKDPQELFAAANKPKKLAIIKGAHHQFRTKEHLKKIIKVIQNFIDKT